MSRIAYHLSLAPLLTGWARELAVLLQQDSLLSVSLVALGLAAIVATEADLI